METTFRVRRREGIIGAGEGTIALRFHMQGQGFSRRVVPAPQLSAPKLSFPNE